MGLGPEVVVAAHLLSEHGDVDNLGEVQLTKEGIVLKGYVFPTVGISWEELRRVLEHPFAQESLEQAWFKETLTG